MDIDKYTLELISKLEFILGSQFYNPNKSRGKKTVKKYRYPILYRKNNKDKNLYETECDLDELSPKQMGIPVHSTARLYYNGKALNLQYYSLLNCKFKYDNPAALNYMNNRSSRKFNLRLRAGESILNSI